MRTVWRWWCGRLGSASTSNSSRVTARATGGPTRPRLHVRSTEMGKGRLAGPGQKALRTSRSSSPGFIADFVLGTSPVVEVVGCSVMSNKSPRTLGFTS